MAARKQPTWRWGLVLIIVFVAVFAATRYFVANDIVDGTSMQPTLQSKQRLVSLKHRLPKRFDIIVLKRPHTLYIKRVIGVPGDTIKVVNGKLWLNGKRQSEPYLNTAFAQRELHRMQQNQPIKHFTADFSLTTLKATRTLKVPPITISSSATIAWHLMTAAILALSPLAMSIPWWFGATGR